MNEQLAKQYIDHFWNAEVIPTISRYIEIPNESPDFDPKWRENGHMQRAVALVKQWVEQQDIGKSKLEVFSPPDRTPLLLLEVEGTVSGDPILLYGHLDKQPAMTGWAADLDPWKPVLRNGKLYGRGGADDGYAIFAVVSAVKALQGQNAPYPRLVTMIECCEESGSPDLPAYVNQLLPRIGTPGLVICLDSGCGNYEQLWSTTSLRGLMSGELTVSILREGVHSGDASGIVPSSFRILRHVLSRLEDPATGRILPPWLQAEIPQNRLAEARRTAEVLGNGVYDKFPFVDGAVPMDSDPVELILNRTWRPTLSVTGQAGMPDIGHAGNVLRPYTSLKLSVRLPPTLKADGLGDKLKQLLESGPPYGADVRLERISAEAGWEAPAPAPWLERAVEKASKTFFGKSACSYGEGGSIPFMGMLGEKFPKAQFLITGVLGPGSNAHGPNEFLHINTARNLTASVASVIEDYARR
jgi:acetylornithine deacetylase/succinyl-diaminopimelate desuccinylase-like protein